MAGRLSVFVAVVLVMCAEFPRSNGLKLSAPTPVIKLLYDTSTLAAIMNWKWQLERSESFASVYIKRHKINDEVNTKTQVASYVITIDDPSININSTYYSQQVSTKKDGGVTFNIKDVTKQTDNKDGSAVNVLVLDGDYVFTCELYAGSTHKTSEIKLIVNEKPKITTAPQSQNINEANTNVDLKCIATGKPLDVKKDITWEINKYGEISSISGPEITISPFTKNNVGVYKCKVKNVYGEVTADAILQYTLCGTDCSSKDLATEFKLPYQKEYDDKNSEKYKKLKKQIEAECLRLYYKQSGPKIYSCVVIRFRSGSVVAVMNLTFPKGTNDPDQPLRDAIKTGMFAGYEVTTSFVSPTTSPPASKPTDKPTDGLTGSPDAGARGTPGLSTGAIVAIVVVFSIIFIVIIVVLIVCMVKRRKPAGSSKPYQEDGAYNKTSAAPLQSQPYKEDPYDNASDDRYPNGGGPPPQYTPSSNYAEVQPSQGEQDDSQVEWDKSVKDEMWI